MKILQGNYVHLPYETSEQEFRPDIILYGPPTSSAAFGKIKKSFGEQLRSRFGPKFLSRFPDKTLMGIEVEVEGITQLVPVYRALWASTEDGSLKDHGAEFISYAMEARNTPILLAHLMDCLQKSNKYKFSPRTSVHVHLNVGCLTPQQLVKLVIYYYVMENFLFENFSPDRRASPFCVPLYQTTILETFFHDATTEASDNLLLKLLCNCWGGKDNGKYSALNLTRLLEIGTAEFRHMEGTDDLEKLGNWLYVIAQLRLAAQSHLGSISDLLTSLGTYNSTSEYHILVETLFPQLHERFMHGSGEAALFSPQIRAIKGFLVDFKAKYKHPDINSKDSLLAKLMMGKTKVTSNVTDSATAERILKGEF